MSECPYCREELSLAFAFCPECGNAANNFPLRFILNERYQINKRLGEGGYGVVYEATDLQRHLPCAVKMLKLREGGVSDTEARFLREAKISLTLQHPNIIKAYELGELNGQLWLAMELLEGETLRDYIERKVVLSPLELLSLMGPICSGVEEAHQRGVVHRDLKPANIIVTNTPLGLVPKILDFGLASFREATSMTHSSMVGGTPRYMAPEQWSGLKHTEAPADIYALGVIIYWALSGKFPFEADSLISWMKKHTSEDPIPLTVAMEGRPMPLRVNQAVMQALAKKPMDRPTSAMRLYEEVYAGLSALLQDNQKEA